MNRMQPMLASLALSLVIVACAATESPGAVPTEGTSEPISSAPATSVGPPGSASASAEGSTPSASVVGDALLAVTLTDVRSGETFTLGELAVDGPILLEPMAVWCTNCRAQQHEVKRAHDAGDFQSVSLDVDLSETPDALADYADREGFDWRFAMADASLYRLLQERFGVAATNPPSTPLIVIEPDGTVRPLEFGRGTRSAEQLLTEVGAG